MLTLGFITEVQDLLDDPGANRYPIAEIVRHGDRQLRGMFRKMAVANKDYSNFTYCAKSTDAASPFKGSYEFRLPTWIECITSVNYRTETAAVQTSFSPYRWTQNIVSIGKQIKREERDPNPRWTWEGNHTLKLWNIGLAPELVIQCVKLPPRMFYGKVQTVDANANGMYLPTPVYGEVEIEEGAYVNSDWQVTATASTNATNFGDVRRCIYSNASTIVVTARQHELLFDANWTVPLAQNDAVQTILPIPDEQTRYLVLRTALACFQKRNAQIGIAAISGELAEEAQRFNDTVQPRDRSGPRRWRISNILSRNSSRDPERYSGNGW